MGLGYLTKINFGKQNNVVLYGIYQLDLQVLLQLQEQLSQAITALLVATAGIMFCYSTCRNKTQENPDYL